MCNYFAVIIFPFSAGRIAYTMPARAKTLSRTRHGEKEEVQVLLPLLRPLLLSASLCSVLEAAVTSAPSLAPVALSRVQHPMKMKEEAGCPPRDKLLQDGWSVKVETALADVQRSREGVFFSSVRDAKMTLALISGMVEKQKRLEPAARPATSSTSRVENP